MSVFAAYARYYDLLYRDKDYAGEARFVSEQLRSGGSAGNTLLELGCGTGRHALSFAALGWDVLGVDLSAAMVTQAHQRRAAAAAPLQDRVTFTEGDVRSVRLQRTFDAAVSLFHVMSYQTAEADLSAAFQTAAAHLRTGGLFLFDFWHGPAVLADPPVIRIKRLRDEATELTRIAEPEHLPAAHVIRVNYDIFLKDRTSGLIAEIRETHVLRYLFIEEIARLLRAAGLELLQAGAWMDMARPLGPDAWYGCAIARRDTSGVKMGKEISAADIGER
jgi:SAM-dependent methyltransferase